MKVVPRCGSEHGYLRSRMDAIILNMFEINYSRLIQYEILEKLVTYIGKPYSAIPRNVIIACFLSFFLSIF